MSILDKDLTSTDVSRPLLKPGAIEFQVAECKFSKTKDGTKDMIEITLKTVHNQDGVKIKGDGTQTPTQLNPGYTLTERIIITETEKRDEERILQDLKKFRMAVTGDEGGQFQPLEQYVGQHVMGNVVVETDNTGQYGAQNRIKSWVRKQ